MPKALGTIKIDELADSMEGLTEQERADLKKPTRFGHLWARAFPERWN